MLILGFRCKNCGVFIAMKNTFNAFNNGCPACNIKVNSNYDPFEWAWQDNKTESVKTNPTW